MRVGEASVRVLLGLPMLPLSSPDAGALTTTGPLHLCLFPTVFVNLIVRKKCTFWMRKPRIYTTFSWP